MKRLILITLAVLAAFVIKRLVAALKRAGHWNQSYERLSKRYAGKQGNRGGASYGYGVNKPSLAFDYGRTFCTLHNRKSPRFSTGRVTEISMVWPNRDWNVAPRTAAGMSGANRRSYSEGAILQR